MLLCGPLLILASGAGQTLNFEKQNIVNYLVKNKKEIQSPIKKKGNTSIYLYFYVNIL